MNVSKFMDEFPTHPSMTIMNYTVILLAAIFVICDMYEWMYWESALAGVGAGPPVEVNGAVDSYFTPGVDSFYRMPFIL